MHHYISQSKQTGFFYIQDPLKAMLYILTTKLNDGNSYLAPGNSIHPKYSLGWATP